MHIRLISLLGSLLILCTSIIARSQGAIGDPRWWSYELDSLFDDNHLGEITSTLKLSDTEVYIGGCFWGLDSVPVNSIAKFDPITKRVTPLIDVNGYNGLDGCVRGMIAWNGGIVVFGNIGVFADTSIRTIAFWKEGKWSALGELSGYVGRYYEEPYYSGILSAAAGQDGKLYVGGAFEHHTKGINYLACWDGERWTNVGGGIGKKYYPYQYVCRLFSKPEGLWVIGAFLEIDGRPTAGIAVWQWDQRWKLFQTYPQIGEMNRPGDFNDALFDKDGSLILAGIFDSIPGLRTQGVVRFKDGVWSSFGEGLLSSRENGADTVRTIRIDDQGNLFAEGSFDLTGDSVLKRARQSYLNMARWDGARWHPSDTMPAVYPLLTDAQFPKPNAWSSGRIGDLVWMFGRMTRTGQQAIDRLVFTDGHEWIKPAGVVPDSINLVTSINNKDLIARRHSGDWTHVDVFRYNLIGWDTMATHLQVPSIHNIFVIDSIVFQRADTVINDTLSRLSRWDGAQWLPCDRNMKVGHASDILGNSSSDFYIMGRFVQGNDTFSVAHFDGSQLHRVLDAQQSETPPKHGDLIARSDDDELYVGSGNLIYTHDEEGWKTAAQVSSHVSEGSIHRDRFFYNLEDKIFAMDETVNEIIGEAGKILALNDSTLIRISSSYVSRKTVAIWKYRPGTLKVENEDLSPSTSGWPNPASRSISVLRSEFSKQPKVYNAIGVLQTNVEAVGETNTWRINVTNLPAGVYIVHDGISQGRFTVVR